MQHYSYDAAAHHICSYMKQLSTTPAYTSIPTPTHSRHSVLDRSLGTQRGRRASKQRVEERGIQAAQQRGQRALVQQQGVPARHALGHAQQHAVGGLHASVSTQPAKVQHVGALQVHADMHCMSAMHVRMDL